MAAVQDVATQNLTRYRHEESENYLARGVECMLLAQESGYADQALLKEACDCYIEAIKFNRQRTEAYAGMAYLLWILGDGAQALRYLEQGLRTNPNHPDIHTLIRRISPKPGTGQAAGRATGADARDDQAEEQAVAQVTAAVKALLAQLEAEKAAAIAASINGHAIERLQEKLAEWELRYDDVLTAIDGLPAFHQRVMLTVELGPVQDRILAYHEALRDSEKLLGLDDKIVENINQVREYLAGLGKGDLGLFRTFLDILLDNCDALADELEMLEKAQLNTRTLESHYQQLAELVEEFQSAVEGDA